MGLFGLFKSIFDDKEMGNQTIKAQVDSMHKLQQIRPGYDTHKMLVEVYLHRLKMRRVDISSDLVQEKAVVDTFMFSCLNFPDCARALGLWILYQEQPHIIEKHPEFSHEFKTYISAYEALVESGNLENVYSKINPHSAEVYGYFG